MTLFALHTMSVNIVSDIYDLSEIKLFKTLKEVITYRDILIMKLRDDYDFDEEYVNIKDNGFHIFIYLNADSFYEIKIQEIKIGLTIE